MSPSVFLVIAHERHSEEVVAVHRTRAGAEVTRDELAASDCPPLYGARVQEAPLHE